MTPIITACALLVALTALVYALWHRYHKRQADRVYSWTEWHHARQWDRYPHNPDVDVKPLKDIGDKPQAPR